MKKNLTALILLLSPLSSVFAGGSMGGGGLLIREQDALFSLSGGSVLDALIPDLGLPTVDVSSDVYRRARMRLSSGLTDVTIQTQAGDLMTVKSLSGGIVDTFEQSQIISELPR